MKELIQLIAKRSILTLEGNPYILDDNVALCTQDEFKALATLAKLDEYSHVITLERVTHIVYMDSIIGSWYPIPDRGCALSPTFYHDDI